MRQRYLPAGRTHGKAGPRLPIPGAWTVALLLCVLIGLLVVLPILGQSAANALSINISASSAPSQEASASHILDVSWKVTGGTAPYEVAIAVTGPDGGTVVQTEEALEGTRGFPLNYPEGGNILVRVDVRDGAGSTVSGTARVTLVPTTSPGIDLGLLACEKMAFSTEEDFVTRGPVPPDGNPIISDGDLLGDGCVICARNRELLDAFDITEDLGLDAVDILDARRSLIAFSTELDSPHAGQFSAGDLLLTNGTVIPNAALLHAFQLRLQDLGLDAVHFVGKLEAILAFLESAQKMGREYWSQAGALQASLRQYDVDIWFSTEGTAPYPVRPAFLDGDLLSARDGIIVARNWLLLPVGVPAGIPNRGVDFGLDAVTAKRMPERESIHFSTELLYRGELGFNDGDVLLILDGVIYTNDDLIRCFEPAARFLGLDALCIAEP
jgi:hypothetical protein